MNRSKRKCTVFNVVKKYMQLECKRSACKSLCKNLDASFLRGFCVEIRHITRNSHSSISPAMPEECTVGI